MSLGVCCHGNHHLPAPTKMYLICGHTEHRSQWEEVDNVVHRSLPMPLCIRLCKCLFPVVCNHANHHLSTLTKKITICGTKGAPLPGGRGEGGHAVHYVSIVYSISVLVIVCSHGNHHLPAPAKKYPIYGTQWHPEKNVFEWTTKEGINHSEHAVIITQTAANFFVSEGECPALLHTFTHVPLVK